MRQSSVVIVEYIEVDHSKGNYYRGTGNTLKRMNLGVFGLHGYYTKQLLMAIRIRRLGETLIAICAARSIAKAGDLYLDDEMHLALAQKFSDDWRESLGIDTPYRPDPKITELTEREESNNLNREAWDNFFSTFNIMPPNGE